MDLAEQLWPRPHWTTKWLRPLAKAVGLHPCQYTVFCLSLDTFKLKNSDAEWICSECYKHRMGNYQ